MKELLNALCVSKAAAARYFGVHRNTVASWCVGDAPLAVIMVLEDLIDDVRDAEVELGFAHERLRDLRDA